MNSIASETNQPVAESSEGSVTQTVLPHSRMLVPVPHPRIVTLKEVQMSCGVAFAAGVVVGEDDEVIGVIENEGRGGETCFRTSGHPRYDWVEAFVAACQRDNEPGVMRHHGGGLLEEEVWDNLVGEFDTATMVAAAARKGRTLVRLVDDEMGPGSASTFAELRGLPNRWSAATVAAAMADQKCPEGRHWEFWDGTSWQGANFAGESGAAPTGEGAAR